MVVVAIFFTQMDLVQILSKFLWESITKVRTREWKVALPLNPRPTKGGRCDVTPSDFPGSTKTQKDCVKNF